MRYEFIGFARGYAIFTIILFHAFQRLALPGFLSKAIVFGGTGVHLFFLLSGFGLALSGRSESILEFFRRRFFKVWAPYVVALTLSLGLAVLWNIFPDRFDAWLAGAGLYQMFFEQYIESFGGHFWFISAIMQLYLVFPILKFGLDRTPSLRRFVWIGLAVSGVWWITVFLLEKSELRTFNSCFLQFLWEFMLGMAVAKAIKTSENLGKWMKVVQHFWQPASWFYWLCGGFFASAVMLLMAIKGGAAGRIFNDVPALVGYGMLSVSVFFFGKRRWPAVVRFFSWIGGFSYSLYLIHIIILELIIMVLRNMGLQFQLWAIPIFVGLAFLGGLIFEKIIRLLLPNDKS